MLNFKHRLGLLAGATLWLLSLSSTIYAQGYSVQACQLSANQTYQTNLIAANQQQTDCLSNAQAALVGCRAQCYQNAPGGSEQAECLNGWQMGNDQETNACNLAYYQATASLLTSYNAQYSACSSCPNP